MATLQISASQLAVLLGPAALSRPIHRSMVDRIALLVGDGRLVDGARLPSERDLAARLSLSRSTVSAAYANLREAGLARSQLGSGNFVSGSSAAHPSRTTEATEGAIFMTASAGGAAPGVTAAYHNALESLPGLLADNGYFPDGLPLLRARLAERYAQRGLPTDPSQLIITTGALSGLNLIARCLLDPGDRALVESPTYPNGLDTLRRHHARLVPAPMTESGWDIDGISSAVRQSAPKLAYLIPDFHNPSGALMDTVDRRSLGLALRRERCIPVIDETLLETGLTDAAFEAPFGKFNPDTITLGSASKAFWGGLRIGWIRAPHAMVRRLIEHRASIDLGAAPVEQLVVAELIAESESITRDQRSRRREQCDHLLTLLTQHFPTWRIVPPAGGETVWIELPPAVSSQLVLAAAHEGLMLIPGHRFFPAGGGERHLRLPFTAGIATLTEAVTRLERAWDRLDAPSADPRSEPYDLIA